MSPAVAPPIDLIRHCLPERGMRLAAKVNPVNRAAGDMLACVDKAAPVILRDLRKKPGQSA